MSWNWILKSWGTFLFTYGFILHCQPQKFWLFFTYLISLIDFINVIVFCYDFQFDWQSVSTQTKRVSRCLIKLGIPILLNAMANGWIEKCFQFTSSNSSQTFIHEHKEIKSTNIIHSLIVFFPINQAALKAQLYSRIPSDCDFERKHWSSTISRPIWAV